MSGQRSDQRAVPVPDCECALNAFEANINQRYSEYFDSLPQKQKEYHRMVLNHTFPYKQLSAPLLLAKQQQILIQNQHQHHLSPRPPLPPPPPPPPTHPSHRSHPPHPHPPELRLNRHLSVTATTIPNQWNNSLHQKSQQMATQTQQNQIQTQSQSQSLNRRNIQAVIEPILELKEKQINLFKLSEMERKMNHFWTPPPNPSLANPSSMIVTPIPTRPVAPSLTSSSSRPKEIPEMSVFPSKPINRSNFESILGKKEKTFEKNKRLFEPKQQNTSQITPSYSIQTPFHLSPAHFSTNRPIVDQNPNPRLYMNANPIVGNERTNLFNPFSNPKPLILNPSVSPKKGLILRNHLTTDHVINCDVNNNRMEDKNKEKAVEVEKEVDLEVVFVRMGSDNKHVSKEESEFEEKTKKLLKQLLNRKKRKFFEIIEKRATDGDTCPAEHSNCDDRVERKRRRTLDRNHVLWDEKEFAMSLDLISSRELRRKPLRYLNARFPKNQICRSIYAGVQTKRAVLDLTGSRPVVPPLIQIQISGLAPKQINAVRLKPRKPVGEEAPPSGPSVSWKWILSQMDFSSPLSQRLFGVLPEFRFKL